jgi:hypothetical protein
MTRGHRHHETPPENRLPSGSFPAWLRHGCSRSGKGLLQSRDDIESRSDLRHVATGIGWARGRVLRCFRCDETGESSRFDFPLYSASPSPGPTSSSRGPPGFDLAADAPAHRTASRNRANTVKQLFPRLAAGFDTPAARGADGLPRFSNPHLYMRSKRCHDGCGSPPLI